VLEHIYQSLRFPKLKNEYSVYKVSKASYLVRTTQSKAKAFKNYRQQHKFGLQHPRAACLQRLGAADLAGFPNCPGSLP